MKKPTITLMVGPPGSGKSTKAKEIAQQDNCVYINQDEQGKTGHLNLFQQARENGRNIVIDRMNFNKAQRNRYLEPVKHQYHTRIIIIHCPAHTCLVRCLSRESHPTIKTKEDADKAIDMFFRKYERVGDIEVDEVIRDGWVDKYAEQVIVCDLDGTLANVEHRRHFVREGKKDWKSFFDNMVNDTVNRWCEAILDAMSGKGRYRAVYATGRPKDYFEHTFQWLVKNSLTYDGYHLFMRRKSDSRRDDIVKEIILEFEIKTRYNILFCLDDRKQVVDMWRKHGYTVLQCDEGNF